MLLAADLCGVVAAFALAELLIDGRGPLQTAEWWVLPVILPLWILTAKVYDVAIESPLEATDLFASCEVTSCPANYYEGKQIANATGGSILVSTGRLTPDSSGSFRVPVGINPYLAGQGWICAYIPDGETVTCLAGYLGSLGRKGDEPIRMGADPAGMNTGTAIAQAVIASLFDGTIHETEVSALGMLIFIKTITWVSWSDPDEAYGFANDHVRRGRDHAYTAKDRRIYVATGRGNQIHIYDSTSGNFQRTLNQPGLKTPDGKDLKAAHLSIVESLARRHEPQFMATAQHPLREEQGQPIDGLFVWLVRP